VTLCLGGELLMYGLVWAGLVLGFLAVNLAANATFGTVDHSLWNAGVNFTRYLFDLAGVMVMVASLPMYLAYGITRRELVAGAVPAGLVLALAAALAVTLVFALEGLVYDVADWPHVLDGASESWHLYDRPDQYGAILLEWFAVYGTHILTGMLIGASFLRWGAAGGALLLPLSALPALGTEVVLRVGGLGPPVRDALDVTPPPTAVGLLAAATLAVAAGAALRGLTRDLAVETHRAAWWR
jgi:hypothetical protein